MILLHKPIKRNKLNEVTLTSIKSYLEFINNNLGTAIYFSTPACSVCKVLKPKLKKLLASEFPEMKFAYINSEEAKELAAQNNVFTVPTILFLFEGKEFIRKSRNINLNNLADELKRPYFLLFS